MDGYIAIGLQAMTGVLTIGGVVFFTGRRLGKMEQKLEGSCKKLDNLPCDEHETKMENHGERIAGVEGFLQGRNSKKK